MWTSWGLVLLMCCGHLMAHPPFGLWTGFPSVQRYFVRRYPSLHTPRAEYTPLEIFYPDITGTLLKIGQKLNSAANLHPFIMQTLHRINNYNLKKVDFVNEGKHYPLSLLPYTVMQPNSDLLKKHLDSIQQFKDKRPELFNEGLKNSFKPSIIYPLKYPEGEKIISNKKNLIQILTGESSTAIPTNLHSVNLKNQISAVHNQLNNSTNCNNSNNCQTAGNDKEPNQANVVNDFIIIDGKHVEAGGVTETIYSEGNAESVVEVTEESGTNDEKHLEENVVAGNRSEVISATTYYEGNAESDAEDTEELETDTTNHVNVGSITRTTTELINISTYYEGNIEANDEVSEISGTDDTNHQVVYGFPGITTEFINTTTYFEGITDNTRVTEGSGNNDKNHVAEAAGAGSTTELIDATTYYEDNAKFDAEITEELETHDTNRVDAGTITEVTTELINTYSYYEGYTAEVTGESSIDDAYHLDGGGGDTETTTELINIYTNHVGNIESVTTNNVNASIITTTTTESINASTHYEGNTEANNEVAKQLVTNGSDHQVVDSVPGITTELINTAIYFEGITGYNTGITGGSGNNGKNNVGAVAESTTELIDASTYYEGNAEFDIEITEDLGTNDINHGNAGTITTATNEKINTTLYYEGSTEYTTGYIEDLGIDDANHLDGSDTFETTTELINATAYYEGNGESNIAHNDESNLGAGTTTASDAKVVEELGTDTTIHVNTGSITRTTTEMISTAIYYEGNTEANDEESGTIDTNHLVGGVSGITTELINTAIYFDRFIGYKSEVTERSGTNDKNHVDEGADTGNATELIIATTNFEGNDEYVATVAEKLGSDVENREKPGITGTPIGWTSTYEGDTEYTAKVSEESRINDANHLDADDVAESSTELVNVTTYYEINTESTSEVFRESRPDDASYLDASGAAETTTELINAVSYHAGYMESTSEIMKESRTVDTNYLENGGVPDATSELTNAFSYPEGNSESTSKSAEESDTHDENYLYADGVAETATELINAFSYYEGTAQSTSEILKESGIDDANHLDASGIAEDSTELINATTYYEVTTEINSEVTKELRFDDASYLDTGDAAGTTTEQINSSSYNEENTESTYVVIKESRIDDASYPDADDVAESATELNNAFSYYEGTAQSTSETSKESRIDDASYIDAAGVTESSTELTDATTDYEVNTEFNFEVTKELRFDDGSYLDAGDAAGTSTEQINSSSYNEENTESTYVVTKESRIDDASYPDAGDVAGTTTELINATTYYEVTTEFNSVAKKESRINGASYVTAGDVDGTTTELINGSSYYEENTESTQVVTEESRIDYASYLDAGDVAETATELINAFSYYEESTESASDGVYESSTDLINASIYYEENSEYNTLVTEELRADEAYYVNANSITESNTELINTSTFNDRMSEYTSEVTGKQNIYEANHLDGGGVGETTTEIIYTTTLYDGNTEPNSEVTKESGIFKANLQGGIAEYTTEMISASEDYDGNAEYKYDVPQESGTNDTNAANTVEITTELSNTEIYYDGMSESTAEVTQESGNKYIIFDSTSNENMYSTTVPNNYEISKSDFPGVISIQIASAYLNKSYEETINLLNEALLIESKMTTNENVYNHSGESEVAMPVYTSESSNKLPSKIVDKFVGNSDAFSERSTAVNNYISHETGEHTTENSNDYIESETEVIIYLNNQESDDYAQITPFSIAGEYVNDVDSSSSETEINEFTDVSPSNRYVTQNYGEADLNAENSVRRILPTSKPENTNPGAVNISEIIVSNEATTINEKFDINNEKNVFYYLNESNQSYKVVSNLSQKLSKVGARNISFKFTQDTNFNDNGNDSFVNTDNSRPTSTNTTSDDLIYIDDEAVGEIDFEENISRKGQNITQTLEETTSNHNFTGQGTYQPIKMTTELDSSTLMLQTETTTFKWFEELISNVSSQTEIQNNVSVVPINESIAHKNNVVESEHSEPHIQFIEDFSSTLMPGLEKTTQLPDIGIVHDGPLISMQTQMPAVKPANENLDFHLGELLQMIPIIIKELERGSLSDDEKSVFSEVFGDLWPVLEEEAKANRKSDIEFNSNRNKRNTNLKKQDFTSNGAYTIKNIKFHISHNNGKKIVGVYVKQPSLAFLKHLNLKVHDLRFRRELGSAYFADEEYADADDEDDDDDDYYDVYEDYDYVGRYVTDDSSQSSSVNELLALAAKHAARSRLRT